MAAAIARIAEDACHDDPPVEYVANDDLDVATGIMFGMVLAIAFYAFVIIMAMVLS